MTQAVLNQALELALRDDDGVEEANALVEATGDPALVEAWRELWRPYALERLEGVMFSMGATITGKLER